MAEVQSAQPVAPPTPEQEDDAFFDALPDAPGSPNLGLMPEDKRTEDQEFFDSLPDAEPTTGEKVGAAARGAAGGGMETGGFLAGAAIGATAGSTLGPVGTFAGGLAGGVGGFLAGREAREGTVGTIEDMPEELRPFGVGGETFGAGVPVIGGTVALGWAGIRMGESVVGRFVNRILDSAAKNPIAFSRTETSALTYAAVAGGTAEAYRPGETLTRVGAEVAAGLLNPARLIHHGAQSAWHVGKRAWQSMTPAGKQTAAAKYLRELLEEAGEDPEMLARLLREAAPEGFKAPLTSAQKTGSPALTALEGKLMAYSQRFGNEARRRAEDGLEATEGLIRLLRGTGDPEALRAAAQIRHQQFRTMVAGRLNMVDDQARQAAARITDDTPEAWADLGRQARNLADDALQEARAVERDLWQRIPRDIEVRGQSILQRHAAIRDELLPEEKLPAVVEGFTGRLAEGQGATTSGELLRFRSRALALAREADAQGNVNDARILGELAEAALDDLSAIGGAPGSAIDEARAFSRVLNDAFTRSFVGTAQATQRTGAARIPPELLMRKAFAAGKEAADVRMQDLENATRFLDSVGVNSPAAAENIELMYDVQKRTLRLAAAEAVDPNTGLVNPKRLANFIKGNERLLKRFPEVHDDLQRAVDSELQRKNLEGLYRNQAPRAVEQRAAFAQALKVENPVDAVTNAIRGRRPISDLRQLITTARKSGPDAVEGLKAAVIDHALRQAGDDFNPETVRSALFNPLGPNQKSLVQVMTDAAVMTADDEKSLRRLLGQADNIMMGMRGGGNFEALADNPDAFQDLLASYIGTHLPVVTGAQGPGQLVLAGRGAATMRRLFQKMPQARVRDALIQAAKDPEFAAMLLTKPATVEEELQLARHLHAYLIQAGFELVEEEVLPQEATAE